jgi:spermidine/putrescine transport system ATP-binding protein
MITKNYIQIKNVTKAYSDGYVAVKDINININRGEFVTILGPSGCGKTTILKMLAGFETPTQGQIIVDNIDIKELPVNQRPTATVFQDYALFPNMNVYQNIIYGLKVMRKPLKNVDDEILNKSIEKFRDATKKAANETKKIKKEQDKILLDIFRVEKRYTYYPEIASIKDMRFSQYDSKNKYYTRKYTEITGNKKIKVSFSNR